MKWFDKAKKLFGKSEAQEDQPDFYGVIFTPRALEAIALGRQQAVTLNRDSLGTEHLLLGLIQLSQGVAINVLKQSGVDLNNLRIRLETLAEHGPEPRLKGDVPYTPQTKKVFERAVFEAKSLNHNYVGTEHLLLAMLAEETGITAQVLRNDFILDLDVLRQEILKELNPIISPSQGQKGQKS